MANEKQPGKTVNPYKTSLDAGNAYWMARLAKAAYTKKPDGSPDTDAIKADLQKEDPDFIDIKGANAKSSQGILVEHKKYFAIAFRGTDELSDWKDNLDLIPQEVLLKDSKEASLKGYFHKGFWDATNDIWQDLFLSYQQRQAEDRKNRQTLKKPVRSLFLTGHSLGGAMATIAAAKLLQQDTPFISAYTFGQPRAMTHQTATIFDGKAKFRFFRFQNNNDIVTRAPARLMNYSHVGSYMYIDEDQKIHNDIGFWYRFLDAVEGMIGDVPEGGLESIKDHDMDLYLAAVKKWECQF